MNKDQIKGQVEQAKGDVKKGIGKALDNKSLEAEGHVDKATGKVRSARGDLKDAIDKRS